MWKRVALSLTSESWVVEDAKIEDTLWQGKPEATWTSTGRGHEDAAVHYFKHGASQLLSNLHSSDDSGYGVHNCYIAMYKNIISGVCVNHIHLTAS